MSLATKYRPSTFEQVLGQSAVIKILKQQLEKEHFTNCYLFTGSSGVGKTSLARLFAKKINKDKGSLIEIDAASNNGVDAVREIVNSANERAIDSEYKIFIIDEVHMLTTPAWNAFLKCIEEPPKYTIFIFCTTNPEKIPDTIKNRVMQFSLSKIPYELINARLQHICAEEKFTNYEEACDYIARLSAGGARDAIALLEKAANYSTDLSIENVLDCLGNFSYDEFFNLSGALLNGDEAQVISMIDSYYDSGKDIKLFVENYLSFLLDLCKFIIFKDIKTTSLPLSLKARCSGYSSIPNILPITNFLLEEMLKLKLTIKNDSNARDTVEIYFIKLLDTCSKMLGE